MAHESESSGNDSGLIIEVDTLENFLGISKEDRTLRPEQRRARVLQHISDLRDLRRGHTKPNTGVYYNVGVRQIVDRMCELFLGKDYNSLDIGTQSRISRILGNHRGNLP